MRCWLAVVLAVSCLACSESPVSSPIASPSPVIGPPAVITLNALAGIGNGYGTAYLTARVTDKAGRAVDRAALDFAADDGVFTPSHVLTALDGQAQTTFKSSHKQVTITATSGDATSAIEVTLEFPPPPPQTPPAVIVPPPPPTPAPPPAPPSPAVVATLSCTAGTNATLTFCNVTATENGLPATGQIVSATWDWADGVPDNATTVTNSHQYTQVGTFIVATSVTMQSGKTGRAQQAVTVK